jgi:hypothetical protein
LIINEINVICNKASAERIVFPPQVAYRFRIKENFMIIIIKWQKMKTSKYSESEIIVVGDSKLYSSPSSMSL